MVDPQLPPDDVRPAAPRMGWERARTCTSTYVRVGATLASGGARTGLGPVVRFEVAGMPLAERPLEHPGELRTLRVALRQPVVLALEGAEDPQGGVRALLLLEPVSRMADDGADYRWRVEPAGPSAERILAGALHRLPAERVEPQSVEAELVDMLRGVTVLPVTGERPYAIEVLLASL